MKSRLVLVAAIFVAAVLNGCGDPTNIKAQLPTFVDTLSVWALSGTPPTYPSGISVPGRQIVTVNANAGFDVALDLNAAGEPVIYPVRLVVSTPGGSGRPVGLQKVAGTFETVTAAPSTGYETDSALVIGAGETVVVQTPQNGSTEVCQFAISPNLYAKITVDSVNLASRILYFRLATDPNCGFRSFADGIPTS
jgi:hypothetical protein